MNDRIELLKNNRQLILDTLEHIKNATNIGIKVTESSYNISVRLPNEVISDSRSENNNTNIVRNGAQLIFSQDPSDGIKIKHKMPQLRDDISPLPAEIVHSIPASALNREIIFKKVIEFLERVNSEFSYYNNSAE